MSIRVPTTMAQPAADPAFDLLVDGLIARLQEGEAVDWPAIAREHREHAGRLRSLAVALEALGDLSGGDALADSSEAMKSGKEECVPREIGRAHV